MKRNTCVEKEYYSYRKYAAHKHCGNFFRSKFYYILYRYYAEKYIREFMKGVK